MTKKPFFDSEEGRAFFSKMLSSMEELKKLKEQARSEDPKLRDEANQKLNEALSKAKDYIEQLKQGNPESLVRMSQLLQNAENLTSGQKSQKQEMEKHFHEMFPHKDSGKVPKKKKHKKNWNKS